MRLIINAPNVHQGGGRTLLLALLKVLQNIMANGVECECIIDERMKIPQSLLEGISVRVVKRTILSRFYSEWKLRRDVKSEDIVHCFGNLPPIFKLKGWVSVLLQNRYMVENLALSGFPLKIRLRINLERLWFILCASHVNEYMVQIPSMKRLLLAKLKKAAPIHVMPFIDNSLTGENVPLRKESLLYDFLYVASGEPHKNHRRLIEAWCLLADEGLFPSLCLTVSKENFSNLCLWMDEKKTRYKLKLVNCGSIPYQEVQSLYGRVSSLIYPTIFESLGLALIEAKRVGLPILASELDFVRDVLDATETFDPYSSVSIARAVKRFLKSPENRVPLSNAADFVQYLINTRENSSEKQNTKS